MNTNRLKIAQEFGNELIKKFGDEIESATIYGSVVNGRDTQESDIDVLIVVKKDKFKIDDKVHSLVVEFLSRTKELISPIVLGKDEFEKSIRLKTPYIQNVVHGGIRIK